MAQANILIVEDDAITAIDLQRTISRLGYTVAGLLTSGEEAIAFLSGKQVDLVLMDIELSGNLNGISTAEVLHRISDIPIVFLTGLSQDSLLEQARITAPYGYLIRPVVERELAATIEMALHRYSLDSQLKKIRIALAKSEECLRMAQEAAHSGTWEWNLLTNENVWSDELWQLYGLEPKSCDASYATWLQTIHPDDRVRVEKIVQKAADNRSELNIEWRVMLENGTTRWLMSRGKPIFDENNHATHYLGIVIDITERKQAEGLIENRIVALTQPLSEPTITLEDLFSLDELQRIQNEFAAATGVASLITRIDGTPLTVPTNFTHLCSKIIRGTEKGNSNCYKSDAIIGRYDPEGPSVRPCLSGGLWDAGVSINVGGLHLGNWLIGQVRNEMQTEESMRSYAREIGADETAFMEAFYAVPAMSLERFQQIAQLLFTLANKLCNTAYQNVQQARVISDRKQISEKLQKSERQYRELVESSNSIILRMDNEGNVLYLNKYAEKFFGYTKNEILNHNVVGTIVPLQDILGRNMSEELQAITLYPDRYEIHENENRTKDGRRVWVSWSNQVVTNETGGVQVMSIGHDITARKQAQDSLWETKEYLENLLDYANAPIIVWDPDFKITRFNHAFETITGRSGAEVVGKPLEILFPHEQIEASMGLIKKPLSGEHWKEIEILIQHVDGSIRTLLWNSATLFSTDGKILIATIGQGQDITERKKVEKRLRESEARFKALHNASFGGITIHDKGLILDCNQGLSDITGYSTDELIGMDGLLLIAPNSRELVMNNIATGYEKPYEALGLHKNGEEYPIRLRGKNIPFRGGEVRSTELRDITQYKRDEAERERLEKQLRQAQKMESVGRLAGGVAHDINNMLGVILGYAEMALDDVGPDNALFFDLEGIRKAASRSADIVKQLLAFARKQTIAPKVIDLNETMSEIVKMLTRLIGEDRNLTSLPGPVLWPIKVDPSQIDQILTNLCVNARDAITDVGRIVIETANCTLDEEYCRAHTGFVAGEFVQLVVSDNGSGMDKKTLSHIFEPFFTTKGVGQGSGLGLATVYGIVKQNNGFINVYSEPGQGTTFTIYFPRYVGTTNQDSVKTPEKSVLRGDETILLVEDEPTILEMGSKMLQRLGYNVLAAGTPHGAIGLAGEYTGEIHLLLTDVIMPEMNGRVLAQQILANKPRMKCLFMSGYTANVISHHGVLEDGVCFIQKPFSQKKLATKIREVLGGGGCCKNSQSEMSS